MRSFLFPFVAAALALGTMAVTAQTLTGEAAIAERKNIMKGVGQATRTASGMSKGDTPFDLAAAKKVFETYEQAAKRMPALFPDDSKTGGETSAAPKIWEDMAGFKAGFAKMEKEAADAGAKTTDLESFKVSFAEVSKNCGACHQTYRIQRN